MAVARGGLWYHEQGQGTPLVLLHGWCMSSAVWKRQLEGLDNGVFRIVTVDLPGHGASSPLSGGFSMPGCVDGLADLFELLDLKGALLAGWSLGAMIAAESLARLRDRVSGVVLIGATPRFTRSDGFPYGLSRIETEGMAAKVRRNIRRALDGFTARMFTSQELRDQVQSTWIRELLASIPVPETEVALQALQALVDADQRQTLPLINIPALIMNGDQDVICLPEASEYIATLIADSDHVVFPDCGHAPFLTSPARFNGCLTTFAEQIRGKSARHE